PMSYAPIVGGVDLGFPSRSIVGAPVAKPERRAGEDDRKCKSVALMNCGSCPMIGFAPVEPLVPVLLKKRLFEELRTLIPPKVPPVRVLLEMMLLLAVLALASRTY